MSTLRNRVALGISSMKLHGSPLEMRDANDEVEAIEVAGRIKARAKIEHDELKKSEREAAVKLPKFDFEAHDINKRPYTDKK